MYVMTVDIECLYRESESVSYFCYFVIRYIFCFLDHTIVQTSRLGTLQTIRQ